MAVPPERSSQARRVVVEGFTILCSILLAFGIEAWWARQQERAEEQIILQSLEREFQAHAQTLAWLSARREALLSAADVFLQGRTDEFPGVSRTDSLLYAVLFSPSFRSGDGARLAVISSGKLDLIEDETLRGLIAGWGEWVQGLAEHDLTMRSFVLETMHPLLDEHGVPYARAVATRRGSPGEQMAPANTEIAYRRLLADIRFENHVANRRDWGIAQRNLTDSLSTNADSILARISRSLEADR